MYFNNKVVWITGASSGIGEALVYVFVNQGAKVIASARRVSEMERVRANCGEKKNQVTIVPLDLADTSEVGILVAAQVKFHGKIDILINNGGISQRSLLKDTPLEIDRRIMEVNYFGQIALTKAVLPWMQKQKDGHLVAISSLTGKFGFPLRSAYAASKHALDGFFETALFELKSENIRVTVINPGQIRTQISLNAIREDGTAQGIMDPGQEKGMPAEVCAEKIITAIRKNKPEVTIGGKEILMVFFKRFIPALFRRIVTRVSAR
ncbi:MAG: SDR family oxidoreductase [Bacteroidia bacterium]|nr:SDR family oxidoreductase [Bacteroidia bacterium]